MTSVLHSKSVVVRLSGSDQLQLEVPNFVEPGSRWGLLQVQILGFK